MNFSSAIGLNFSAVLVFRKSKKQNFFKMFGMEYLVLWYTPVKVCSKFWFCWILSVTFPNIYMLRFFHQSLSQIRFNWGGLL